MATANDSVSPGRSNSVTTSSPVTRPAGAAGSWQRQLQDAVRDVAELAALLELPTETLAPADEPRFPLRVPRAFVARMRKGDPRDPLLLQVLPTMLEQASVPGFTADPVEEIGLAHGGVVRKYAGRALLIATGACPVHCRYCFRREFPYPSQLAARADWGPALAAVREQPGTDEVILSGGDPLSLGNARLGALLRKLEALGTLRRVRIHTRFPIVLPARVDDGLLGLLSALRLTRVVVVHANHPNELDDDVADALHAIGRTGTTVLNQSVLLRGVNDDADVLAALSERLLDCGAVPYYLHLLDPVAGAAHFDVDEAHARALHAALTARLPGYLVPRLVREIPGRASKTRIA